MDEVVLAEMSEDEVLDFADTCAETARRAEVDLLRAAYQWSVLHSPDRLDPTETTKPGREQARHYAGPGTAMVTEFAAATLGVRIARSTYAARQLIADAQDLLHRHPQLWARVQAGEVRASYARHVAHATRDLQPVEAAYVDAGVVESADGRITWTRFTALVAAKVAQAAPAMARENEEQARRATFAKKLDTETHGMASFLIRADIATIDALDAAVTTRSDELKRLLPDDPDLQTDDHRRVRAILELATGTTPGTDIADLLPGVELVVHTYAGPDREAVMRIEGHHPVTEDWVRDLLGPRARFTIRPVLDLAGQAPVDAWELPDRHRQAVRLMTPADTFPYSTCTTRTMQVDHTVPYHQGGASGIGNYGPMTTLHHRIKTHSRFQVRQPFPGIYLWRDPGGACYLVDHTGTRRLPKPEPRQPDASNKPLVVELWRVPYEIKLDYVA